MSITITLPTSFEIENYTGLQAFLTDHMELPQEVVDQLPNLIRLAELRLSRLLTTPARETWATLVSVAGTQTASLPSGYAQGRQLKVTGDQGYPLAAVTLNVAESYDYEGKPQVYAVHGSTLYFGPIPDAAYTFTLRYAAKLAPLTQNSQVNWLLRDHADAYVYMACSVIANHLGDGQNATLYLGFANAVIDEINTEGLRHRRIGPMRLRSPVVV